MQFDDIKCHFISFSEIKRKNRTPKGLLKKGFLRTCPPYLPSLLILPRFTDLTSPIYRPHSPDVLTLLPRLTDLTLLPRLTLQRKCDSPRYCTRPSQVQITFLKSKHVVSIVFYLIPNAVWMHATRQPA